MKVNWECGALSLHVFRVESAQTHRQQFHPRKGRCIGLSARVRMASAAAQYDVPHMLEVATCLLGDTARGRKCTERRFRMHFFCSPQMAVDVWCVLLRRPELSEFGLSSLDMLRFLYFIRVYGTSLDVIATRFHMDEDTLKVRLRRMCTVLNLSLPVVRSLLNSCIVDSPVYYV